MLELVPAPINAAKAKIAVAAASEALIENVTCSPLVTPKALLEGIT